MVMPEHRRANHLRRLGNSRPEASEPKPDILNTETPDPIAKTPQIQVHATHIETQQDEQ